MYAKRMNRSYSINTPQEKQAYLARGFDIYDDDDDLVEASPQKTVAYSEFQKLRAASETMRKELYSVRAENEQLKAQLADIMSNPVFVTPPDGVPEAFDAQPLDPAPDAPDAPAQEDGINTLHSQDQSAPKMGKKR